jgi:hypothetical protein
LLKIGISFSVKNKYSLYVFSLSNILGNALL